MNSKKSLSKTVFTKQHYVVAEHTHITYSRPIWIFYDSFVFRTVFVHTKSSLYPSKDILSRQSFKMRHCYRYNFLTTQMLHKINDDNLLIYLQSLYRKCTNSYIFYRVISRYHPLFSIFYILLFYF